MKKIYLILTCILTVTIILGCSQKLVDLTRNNITLINREIISTSVDNDQVLILNNERGSGLAILNNVDFEVGVIELDLKGENKPGGSFVGLAFNIQNDTTYEAIYFRPFNFQADEPIKREHAVQYISHPQNTWNYLRTNYEGEYEAEYPRRPSPDNWFEVKIIIESEKLNVYDKETNAELLSVKRLESPVSGKIAFWTGNNSKGEFKNLRLIRP